MEQALLRLPGIKTADGEPGTVEFQVYLDEPGATEGSPKKGPTCLGAVNKRLSGEIDNIVMDITPHAERLMDAGHNWGLIHLHGKGRARPEGE